MHRTKELRPERTAVFKLVLNFAILAILGLGIIVFHGVLNPAHAIQFEKGEIIGSIDTTVTLGTDLRAAEPSKDLIGYTNGGRQFSINTDNGTQNFDNGEPVDGGVKVTHELDVTWRNYGFFGRMYWFYDWALMCNEKRRYALTRAAEDYSGRNIKLLDAYFTADFTPFDRPLTIRLGNQVLSWGESTFIQFGINIINPVDVSKLRAAGAELRDALLPLPMISLNAGVTDNLSVEMFYQFYWQQTEIEPTSTFFSSNDFAGPGGQYVFLSKGLPPDQDHPTITPPGAKPPTGDVVTRGDDNKAADMGQGGIALRYFSPPLNDTEFGLYFVNYHSRMPYLSGFTGDAPPPYPADPTSIVEWLGHTDLLAYGLLSGDYASSAYFIRDYPENIQMVGGSFSTEISDWGLAIQGEVSYRPNVPLQIDDVELLEAAMSPLDPYLVALKTFEAVIFGGTAPSGPIFGRNQLGPQEFNQYVQGWRRKQVLQPQMTLTKIFGPTFGFIDQMVVLGEVGAMWVLDMEDQSVLRYEGPGTFCSADPYFTRIGSQPATQADGFATPLSWGYRLAARADLNNAIGPVNLQPTLAFSHDVNGTSPSPTASFLEGRMAATVALEANYLNRYRLQVAYTNYFSVVGVKNAYTKSVVYGQYRAGELNEGLDTLPKNLYVFADYNNNLIHDRDFVSIAFSYSF